jgi:hypothetical protein
MQVPIEDGGDEISSTSSSQTTPTDTVREVAPQHASGQPHPHQASSHEHRGLGKVTGPKRLFVLFTGLVLLLIVLTVAGLIAVNIDQPDSQTDEKSVNTSEFQALFLTNGQVYFGKLSNVDGRYVTLTNIFYLQVQQTATGQQSVQPASTTTNQSQVSLAKLGNELHGPEDKMLVSKDQVLFWENLKSTSKVVEAITKYQK